MCLSRSNKGNADILLVEDDAIDAELTLRALRESGLANPVMIVRDGHEALDYIQAGQAARYLKVVLLDLDLPGLSGFEVLARLRANESTRLIPTVVLTSSEGEPYVRRAYELGANGFITKPIHSEAFIEAIARAGVFWVLVNCSPA